MISCNSLLFLLVVATAQCSGENWICHKISLGNVSSEFIEEYIGDGHIDKSHCGEVCASGEGRSSTTWIGYVAAMVASVCFGINFLPVKKFDTGDGMFFQWVQCLGVWLVGVVVNLTRDDPPFFYPAMMGGFLWTIGNLFTVPVIKLIGLTMALTIWGVANLVIGWIAGKFIIGQYMACPPLNYGGVACVVLSTFILAFVKSEGKKMKIDEDTQSIMDKTPLINSSKTKQQNSSSIRSRTTLGFYNGISTGKNTSEQERDEDFSWVDRIGKCPRRIIGFGLAIVVGVFYGSQFLPVEFLRLCDDQLHTCNELDYVFGHCTGVLLSSTLWFVIYCTVMKNKPQVYPSAILPGLLTGILTGIAFVACFLANQYVSLAVSYPIITAGPGFVSSALGILVFREIKGWVNIVLYFAGFSVSLAGLVLVGLSICTHCKY